MIAVLHEVKTRQSADEFFKKMGRSRENIRFLGLSKKQKVTRNGGADGYTTRCGFCRTLLLTLYGFRLRKKERLPQIYSAVGPLESPEFP